MTEKAMKLTEAQVQCLRNLARLTEATAWYMMRFRRTRRTLDILVKHGVARYADPSELKSWQRPGDRFEMYAITDEGRRALISVEAPA